MKTRNEPAALSAKTLRAAFYARNHGAYALSVLATALTQALLLGISWILMELMNAISGEAGAKSLENLALMIAVYLLLFTLVSLLSRAVQPRFLRTAMEQYKALVLEKLMGKSLASFEREPTSAYLSALSNDAAVIEGDYLEAEFQIIGNLLDFCGAFLLMLYLSPLLTVVVAVLTVLPMAASMGVGRRLEPLERQVSEDNASFTAALKDCLSGFSVVKSFRSEGAFLRLLSDRNGALEERKQQKRRLRLSVSMVSIAAGLLAQFGVFFAGVWMVQSGRNITVGTVIAFVNLMNCIVSPISELPGLLTARRAAVGLLEKMANLLCQNSDRGGLSVPPRLEQGIRLSDVSFRYEAGREVLHGVSAAFEAGKCYAIVGSSGCGKSTLLHLLRGGAADYQGSITYDGAEGRDISNASLSDLVASIQQTVFVFNATLRENVTMFRDFPEEDVAAALRMANLTGLVADRGEGCLCGEGGAGLSGGEKQRIAIARSLLRRAAVLLVDEATAALDAETAYQVSSDLLNLLGVTRIVVTHTLEKALLVRYDQILVMKDGAVVETGTFDTLMAEKGLFYALYTVAQ
ncbi:MAG: ABC transporter ATP-binding protein/permease [Clostridiales bacterium]|nr:ABC transporter ATP-binding protein/permease [Clostridiales bacterium]